MIEREKAALLQSNPYAWLRPAKYRSSSHATRGRRRDGPDLPRSREFRRPPSVPFTSDLALGSEQLQVHGLGGII